MIIDIQGNLLLHRRHTPKTMHFRMYVRIIKANAKAESLSQP